MKDEEKKVEREGFVGRIFQDTGNESPDDWGNDDLFLVGFSQREFWVERKGFKQSDFEDEDRLKEIKKEYHVFPIEAYIHGGVALYMSGGCMVDRNWDVSQIGFILAKKEVFETLPEANKTAHALLESWNNYLSGDVHGITITDPKGEEIENCWGFFGSKYAEEELETRMNEAIEEWKKSGLKRYTVTWSANVTVKSECYAKSREEAEKMAMGNDLPVTKYMKECVPVCAEAELDE